MALGKERMRHNLQSSLDPSLEFLGSDQGHFPTYFDLSNSSNIGFLSSLRHEHEQSINVNHWAYSSSSSSSLLSFNQGYRFANSNYSNHDLEHEECTAVWIDNMDCHANCFEMASGYGEEERASQKRAYMGVDMLASKKHCSNDRKAKAKPSPSKDSQSISAKNRRERISERLKILQDLVPNGTKVDLVTMLEKAISYVKFLQLQVKVLATDEFWPAQGGKAPEVSQVKEAIDAILSSHRDRNSSTSKH